VRLTILHTNDIHGHQARLAQIATIVERVKANADHTVLYLDAGDVEDTTNRLSNLTKGTAMHRLAALRSRFADRARARVGVSAAARELHRDRRPGPVGTQG
jgi:hypothetical protein